LVSAQDLISVVGMVAVVAITLFGDKGGAYVNFITIEN
jgi:hypothetical protein